MLNRSGVQNHYSHKVRIANWSEDQDLKELQMKEYLHRKVNGQLLVHSVQRNLNASLQEVGLSYSRDGYLHIGDHVMLYSVQTQGVLSTDVSEVVNQSEQGFSVTTSTLTKAHVARNTFVIEGYGNDVKTGDRLKFGQPFRMRINPKLKERPHYLMSQPLSQLAASKISRRQEVIMAPVQNADSLWLAGFKDIAHRFENEGQPVPANAELVLFHSATRQALSTDKVNYFNDFGLEYEVCCHSSLNVHKKHTLHSELRGATTADIPARQEHLQNHWAFLTASTPEMEELLNAGGDDKKIEVNDLVRSVVEAIKRRGPNNLGQLGKRFRLMDRDRSMKLDSREVYEGLVTIGINLSQAELRALIEAFDTNRDGNIDYTEFLSRIRGPVPPARSRLVDIAFGILDKNGNGVVQLDDLQGVYNAKFHPDVKDGRRTEDSVLTEFLANFEGLHPDGTVTREEFHDYYATVGAYIDRDDYFELMMTRAWPGLAQRSAQLAATTAPSSLPLAATLSSPTGGQQQQQQQQQQPQQRRQTPQRQ